MDGEPGLAGPPGPPGPQGPPCGGAIYTRWGKSSCPEIEGTEFVYTGITGGSFYTHKGGGANHLCMPTDGEYSEDLAYKSGANGLAYMYGAEYEGPLRGTQDYNVPCAVCHVSTRPTVMMIPAKYRCPTNWTMEYYGYLMSAHHGHHRSTYECVDAEQAALSDSLGNSDGALFYHVEAICSSGHFPSPPYDPNKELNCVVCTK